MLDVCTGTGLLALAGARMGAGEVHAVDVSCRAAVAARWNALVRGLPVTVHRGDFLREVTGRFDVVTANPPYVPCAGAARHAGRRARAWDGGEDGRAYLDRLCAAAPRLMAENGVLLIAQSALADAGRTVELLREAGLRAAVTARAVQPFGPVMRSQAPWLEARGLIAPGRREEELVIVRGDFVRPGAGGADRGAGRRAGRGPGGAACGPSPWTC